MRLMSFAIVLCFLTIPASAQLEGWAEKTAGGGTITTKDGWTTFEGADGAVAHIERANDKDNVTISCKLVRWAAIYLVWDKDNWAGLGKTSPTPFGRFSSIDVVGGAAHEFDHRGVDFNLPHAVRVQLGANHVTFQYQLDGKWTDLRRIERPREYAGAPKLVAAGKYYGAEDRLFGAGRKPAGDRVSGAIRELRVEQTSADDLRLTHDQLEAIRHPTGEPVNALLKQSDDDPTYEQIVKFYPPFRYPRELIGVPEHVQEIGVDYLGRLDNSPWAPPKAWFLIGDSLTPFGQPGTPFKRRLLSGYIPVDTISRVIDGVEHELTVFGWSEKFSVDKDTYVIGQFTSKVVGKGMLPKQIQIAWGNGDGERRPLTMIPDDSAVSCFFKMKWPEPASVTAIDSREFDARLDETVKMWQSRLPGPIFDLPDDRVMEAYHAWIAYAMLNADTINGYLEPHDGGGFYDSMFGNSVSLHSIAMNEYGQHDYAAKILKMQCHYQHDDGLYTQDCGLTDAGGFLAGLAMHYGLTGDEDWLRSVAYNINKQCDWIIRERAKSPKDGVAHGLIKFRPYNDYRDPVYNYLGNAWCAQGMKLAASALKEIGIDGADKYIAEAEQYRKDIYASMDVAKFDRDGATLLPIEPDTHRLLKLSKYRGGDYYGLVASSLLGTDFLGPRDSQTDLIVKALEEDGGLIAGVCEFEGGIDHAYTFGYLNNALKRDEVNKALLGFWSFMAFGMTRDTYSPVEVTMIDTGENHYTLPHLYSCTEQLRLLRNLLVREEGDVLWLGQGIPREWLAKGKHVRVSGAPTEFGEVTYQLSSDEDTGLTVTINPPTRNPPTEIRLRLRDPQKRAIKQVVSETDIDHTEDDETITLENVRSQVRLHVSF
jgi:hypothetical protein